MCIYIYIHTYTHHILYMYIIRLQFFCFDPDPLIVNLVNTAKDSRLHNGFAESGGQERTQVTLGLSTQLPSHWFWTRHSSRILRLTQYDQALSYFRKRCSSLHWNDIMKTLPGQPGVPEKGCRLSKGCFDPSRQSVHGNFPLCVVGGPNPANLAAATNHRSIEKV
jgi:hypothetical protein